jgi:peptidoglycan hydrolase CwlO-like protein
MSSAGGANIDTEVALLKSDVNRITSLFDNLLLVNQKMAEVSNSIERMLAVHEEKLNSQTKINEDLFDLVEHRKQELQNDIRDLHSRISTVSRELSGDINETEKRLMSAMTTGMADIKKCITQETEIVIKDQSSLEKRISELEKWKWMIMGGSVILGAFAHEITGIFLTR